MVQSERECTRSYSHPLTELQGMLAGPDASRSLIHHEQRTRSHLQQSCVHIRPGSPKICHHDVELIRSGRGQVWHALC